MPSRRRSRADVLRDEHTFEWLIQREDAETRRCPTCLAAPGATCANVHTGERLTWQPAHRVRLAVAAGGSAGARQPGPPSLGWAA